MTEVLTEADALLRDILENPDDLTPRLVYADWQNVVSVPLGVSDQVGSVEKVI